MSISAKKLAPIFTSMGMAASLSACAGMNISSPLPKYTNINQTDPSSCMVVKHKSFNPGWFLLIGFNKTDTTGISQDCFSRQIVENLFGSNDVYFSTIAVEYYNRAPQDQKTLMDQAMAMRNTNIEEVTSRTPRFVGGQEQNGMYVLHYRMPGAADNSPPAIIARPLGISPLQSVANQNTPPQP